LLPRVTGSLSCWRPGDCRSSLADAARNAADDSANRRLAHARQLGAEMIAASAAFDTAITAARSALDQRSNLLTRLVATGCLRSTIATNLSMPSRVRRAFARELGHFIGERIAARHCQALADADRAAASGLQKPTIDGAAAKAVA
jgi:hypothetical protein